MWRSTAFYQCIARIDSKALISDYAIGWFRVNKHNKRLKRDCQRVAFPVPMSRGGCSCCD
ncbi:hypothetical protein FLL71_16645 [Vibrio cholerae]|nr:hypothetical protein FLL71_16645 [Vibrio cholerae]